MKSYTGNTNIKLSDFNGTNLWEVNLASVCSSNSSTIHFRVPKTEFKTFSLNSSVLSASFISESKTVFTNYFFAKPKELKLTKPTIQVIRINKDSIELTSDVLAKNIFLSSNDNTFFSDNYFDILPNQKVLIQLSKPTNDIVVKSLFNTLN